MSLYTTIELREENRRLKSRIFSLEKELYECRDIVDSHGTELAVRQGRIKSLQQQLICLQSELEIRKTK